jgi:hypothetical protein
MREKISSVFLALVLVILIPSSSTADIREILTFRDVEIPWNLKQGDVVIENGTYDVLLIKHGIELFCLKLRQAGKTICIVKNPQRLKYAGHDNLYDLMRDDDVPKEARLRIKRIPALNTVYFMIETGNCRDCKFQKLRFKMESTET